MWYKPRPMRNRRLAVTLLLILAVQLLGAMAFASTCPDPCPDDAEGTSCPPVCTLCTGCTHAQTAIVQHSANAVPLMSPQAFVAPQAASTSWKLAADIFHVPLLG